jgi:hypothetical protein
MRKGDNAVVSEKLTRYQSSVRRCIVIMEQPIARAPYRSSSPNVLPPTAKNTAVELGVHGLAFGGKFIVHSLSNVEKHDEELVSKLFDTLTYILQRISPILQYGNKSIYACMYVCINIYRYSVIPSFLHKFLNNSVFDAVVSPEIAMPINMSGLLGLFL